jgi:hypothetical protein
MKQIVPIVEGDGEVDAFPVLLRRLAAWMTPEKLVNIAYPIRVRRDRFLNKQEEFSRQLLLAASKCAGNGWIIILLDADDDCPVSKAAEIFQKAQILIPHQPLSVILANREYEAWFIAAADSLNGQRGFNAGLDYADDPDAVRGAKEWMSRHLPPGRKYYEKADQPAFSQRMDLELACRGSRSFRKLCSEWKRHVGQDHPS